jgi:poly-gamma-glutamate synthesis protein (capsule biosynthesis protein)
MIRGRTRKRVLLIFPVCRQGICGKLLTYNNNNIFVPEMIEVMKKYLMLGLLSVLISIPCLTAGSFYNHNIQPGNDNTREKEISKQSMISKQQPEQPEQQPIQSEESLKLVVGGDVLLYGSVGYIIDKQGNDSIWGDIKDILDSADISMINLEGPLSCRGSKEKDKQFTFRGKPEYAETLKSAGIDIVSLANNHVMDYGEISLLDTMKHLDDAGILYAGAGQNEHTANMPVYIDKGSIRIAILSSSHVIPFVHWHAGKAKPGVASAYDPARLLSEVKIASEKADVVLVYLHWGKEMKTQPVQYQKNLARMLIDSGADLVVGSHPHIIQGLEFYKGKLIAYSLGNFVFTNSNKETMLLSIKFSKEKMLEAYVIPCIIKSSRTSLVKNESEIQNFFSKLNKLSSDVFIHKDGRVEQTL